MKFKKQEIELVQSEREVKLKAYEFEMDSKY